RFDKEFQYLQPPGQSRFETKSGHGTCSTIALGRVIRMKQMMAFKPILLLVACLTAGCSDVSFQGSTPKKQGDPNDPNNPPQNPGVSKNSYFFVRRAADILFVV